MAHIDAFHADPRRFWSFYRPRFHALSGTRPNGAHEALAELERRGLIEAVITQNIDMLHRRAGTNRLVEVHGSIARSRCQSPGCDRAFGPDQLERLFDAGGVPRCPACEGLIKPGVVLFGELLPRAALAEAELVCRRAELILAVGSSLEVHPAAGLPALVLERGGRLALVTKGTTPYDDAATLKLDGDVEHELEAVIAALDRAG